MTFSLGRTMLAIARPPTMEFPEAVKEFDVLTPEEVDKVKEERDDFDAPR